MADDSKKTVDISTDAQDDSTNREALREAARLGGDNFLVKSDLEDADQREFDEDGNVGSMANADNPEK